VDFILRATGYKVNFAVIPAPASEYRSAAGWKEGKEWWAQRHDIDSLLTAEKGLDIVFLGNSITQATAGHRPNVTGRSGFAAFDSLFQGYTWECAGISGDRTQHLLWRLQNGSYKEAQPKVIVVTIGVNNFPDDSPEEVAAGIREIVTWIGTNLPQTKIVLCGPLPAGTKQDNMLRVKYEKVHDIIQKYRGKNLIYLNLSRDFIKSDGDLNPDLCASDGIHLVKNGYRVWGAELRKVIDTLGIH
jgi:lysophospholipase L1-like esterase